jgi:outer membrane receptor for ferrienterochelin and colicins
MRRDIPSFELGQGEERQHHVYTGSVDYQINSDDKRRSLIAYMAAQHTDRDHYTGILPTDPSEQETYLDNPPVGTSQVTTINSGLQVNADISQKKDLSNVITLGTEVLIDNVFDEITAYNYLIDQSTTNVGLFAQSDWQLSEKWNLLSGLRLDHHNLVDRLLLNPRLALLYKPGASTRVRLSYGTGFRAPQAFDADLHIAFAGGGISRVRLSPELAPEQSQSWSASVSHDVISERYIAGFTVETFYTRLNDAFFLQPVGQDSFGEVFEKQNSDGATVGGVTLELRANYDRKVQLETGITYQQSRFDNAVQYIDDLPGVTEFVRTPDLYGFATLSYTPDSRWSSFLSYVYTGSMLVPHFAGSPTQLVDEIITSSAFHDLQAKVSYALPLSSSKEMSISLGCRNIFNAYQSDFDIGPNRDSNFIYGPALPRTFFLGVVING